ncbi:MAG: hypothetical protein ACTSPB_01150 [Candidatus Thorarchaeota archaeon]
MMKETATMKPLIDANRVGEIYEACLSKEGKEVEVCGKHTFNFSKVEEHKDEILKMLMNLPLEFREKEGGGWSFLKACNDKNDIQWTGFHARMEQLFALGVAIDRVVLLLPRSLWSSLPAGMPYLTIKDDGS